MAFLFTWAPCSSVTNRQTSKWFSNFLEILSTIIFETFLITPLSPCYNSFLLHRYCLQEGSYTFALNDTALAAGRNKHAMARFSYTTDTGTVVSVDLTGTETVANFDIDIDPNDDDDDAPWYEVAGIVVAIVIGFVVIVYGGCIW
jgi:hypothetical protein